MTDNLKILVVDDTIVYRKILSDIVTGFDGVELMGTAPHGQIALSKIGQEAPDAVLLDVSMPVMDGIETLTVIRKEHPDIDVIMVSGADEGNASLTMKALNLGALDFIPKPKGTSPDESLRELTDNLRPLIRLIKTRAISRHTRRISGAQSVTPPQSSAAATPVVKAAAPAAPVIPAQAPATTAKPTVVTSRKAGKIDVVALGVSTGGPNALGVVIPALEDLKVPILAVQHMPPMFTASLAERLDKTSSIGVVEGSEGLAVSNGTMYIAPGGKHMVVRKNAAGEKVLGITDAPPVNSCKPSVDVLFRSIAMVYGGNVLTVILTGMGNDGAAGVAAIRRKGGYSIVQNEETCVVWGMPQAVVAANEADEILPLDAIAQKIMDITR